MRLAWAALEGSPGAVAAEARSVVAARCVFALFCCRERLRELKEEAKAQAAEEGDYMASMMAIWTTPFLPNLMNTMVFLVETSQQVGVLVVNYKVS